MAKKKTDPFKLLLAGLKSADPVVAADAARLLGELGRRAAARPLVAYVTKSGHYHKAMGFHALARLGDRSVVAQLRPLVDKPNVRDDWYWYGCRGVRASAAVALLALGDQTGAAWLRQLADENNAVFYAWFAPALLRLPDELPATRELKARLTVAAIWDSGNTRLRIVEPGRLAVKCEALGLLGGPDAGAALLELMKFHSRYVRGQAALSLLQASRAAEHVKAVEALADGDPTDFVRLKASLALTLAGRKERAKFVAKMARGAKDPFERAVAVEALGALGDAKHAATVRGQLKHADAYVRQCALEALERLDAKAAAAAAKAALKDKSPRVPLQAAKILAAQDSTLRPTPAARGVSPVGRRRQGYLLGHKR